jgi:GTP pyrophosphokinase
VSADVARSADLKWLDRLLAWQPLSASEDFLTSLRADLDGAGFLVFASDGSTVALPNGATGVDFAFMTNPEAANRATGILVNGIRRPIERELGHGQVVQLIMGPPADPPGSWLDAARSGQARVQLQQWFARRDVEIAREEAEQASAAGRCQLAEMLPGHGVDLLDLEADGTAHSECRKRGYQDLDALYEAVGNGEIRIDDLLTALLAAAGEAPAPATQERFDAAIPAPRDRYDSPAPTTHEPHDWPTPTPRKRPSRRAQVSDPA